MADHTDNALLAAVKALDEVVAPAVDAANPLAGEQLRLVSRYISFLRTRLAWQADRDRFELRHYLALARQLRPCALDGPVSASAALDRVIDLGASRVDASTAELRAATAALSTAISMLVRASAEFGAEPRRRIETAVVLASKTLFDVQRAYYLPLGFEPDPSLVPELDDALRARA